MKNFFSRHFFWYAFKAFVFVLMAGFIIQALFLQNDFAQQVALFRNNFRADRAGLLLAAVLLMPFNWLLETYKWKILLGNHSTRFLPLLKGVLAGITFGFITPGRSGEFFGRVLYAEQSNRTEAFYLSTIGGMAQTTVTLMAGIYFISYWKTDSFLSGLAIGLCGIFLLLYFRFDWLQRGLKSVPFLQRKQWIIREEELPDIRRQSIVLLLSFFRYGIYLLQYCLVFGFFAVAENFLTLLVHSGVLLLVQSFSPLMPLLDLGYRGGSALYVFKNVSDNHLAVVVASLTVWFINLAVPALIGYLVIFRKNNFK